MITEIIQKLKKIFYEDIQAREISFFLCGGASKEQSKFRFYLGSRIENMSSPYTYSVYYPETLFSELLLGHGKNNLLTLENFLAESVNVVIIPLESVGTFSEIGAFSNHATLRNKLIVLMNPKYQRSNSFINNGPIKYLKSNTTSRIIYTDFYSTDFDTLLYKITDAARSISNSNPLDKKLDNPLISQIFYVCLVYIFDPIDIKLFMKIIEQFLVDEIKTIKIDTIISSILQQTSIKLIDNSKLSFNENGFQKYLAKKGYSKSQIGQIKYNLTNLRYKALNLYYKKKGIYLEGEYFTP